jgi:2-desacetyl-2-hydroxyethyl bacteriochlorophyllide A dehydrogenase
MKRHAVYFEEPRRVNVRQEPLPLLQPGELLVETTASAISTGTELLVYRGEVPSELTVDETISSLPGTFRYPLKYGYTLVGNVVDTGTGVPGTWKGSRIFSFHPHESHFVATPGEVRPVPADISADDALFFPNMETALTLALDGKPLVGEHVAVFGQGVVGLLLTSILAMMPLARIVTFDPKAERRRASIEAGAHHSFDPAKPEDMEEAAGLFGGSDHAGADLVYEVSGNPAALDQAIGTTGYSGRVVVGSWYGTKRAVLDLGGAFHRSRIGIKASQVSSIEPELRGRWSKERMAELVWEMTGRVHPGRWVSHRFEVEKAAEAYELLDRGKEGVLQVVLEYKRDARDG